MLPAFSVGGASTAAAPPTFASHLSAEEFDRGGAPPPPPSQPGVWGRWTDQWSDTAAVFDHEADDGSASLGSSDRASRESGRGGAVSEEQIYRV